MKTMSKLKTQMLRTALAGGALALLVACGGGGGDTAGVPSTPAPADLQAFVPSKYAAGSPQEYMFNKLNDARVKCGFGALRHDARLDKSAQSHADYLAMNNVSGHKETAGLQGFTGLGSFERILNVGYKTFGEDGRYWSGEGISYMFNENANHHKDHIPGQLSAVYHSSGALGPFRDIGFGIAKRSTYNYTPETIALHNLGSETPGQKLAEGGVATYPCDGVTNLRTYHPPENPSPLASRDFHSNPPGHPIMILSRLGTTLSDVGVTMTEVATGAALSMAAVRTSTNDTTGLVDRFEAFAIPDAQLKKSTSYRVKINGKVDGVAFEKSFTFSTGTVDQTAVLNGRYE